MGQKLRRLSRIQHTFTTTVTSNSSSSCCPTGSNSHTNRSVPTHAAHETYPHKNPAHRSQILTRKHYQISQTNSRASGESGNKNLKVGQEGEQSGNKVGTRTSKWDKNGNKVGTKWEQEPQSGTRMGTKWERSGNKNLKVGLEWETK